LSSNHLLVILKFDRVNITKNELTLNKTNWSEFLNKSDGWRVDHRHQNAESIDQCIIRLQKFILKTFKQSSTYQHRKKRVLITEDDRAAINKLIKFRNYYRRKYQRSSINRYRLFRNVLNNYIKAALIDGRNNY